MSKIDTVKWLQLSVNNLVERNYLQFIASIWNVDVISEKVSEKIESIGDSAFPYLDMEFFWYDNELHTRVHTSKNAALILKQVFK